jgi:hypothetical protein
MRVEHVVGEVGGDLLLDRPRKERKARFPDLDNPADHPLKGSGGSDSG